MNHRMNFFVALCMCLSWVLAAPASAQDAAALLVRGHAHFHGNGVRQDYVKAADYYRRAAEMGYHKAQTWYGYMLAHGYGVPKDPGAAFRWIASGARGREPVSLYQLGAAYYKGWGVRPDKAEACRWFKRSAKTGDPRSAHQTGRCYQEGYNGEVNLQQALAWFRRGANFGFPASMRQVGYYYQKGLGTPRDYAQALTWYRRAGEAGDPIGQNDVGYMYYQGLGIPRDYAIARYWFRKSADKGNTYAMYNLGEMYENGYGVGKDPRRALSWYERAERGGHPGVSPKVKSLRIELADFDPLPPPPKPDRRTTRRTDCGPHGIPVWNGNVQSCNCDRGYVFVGNYGGVAVNTCVKAPDLGGGMDIESIPMDDYGPTPGTSSVLGQD